MGRAERQRRQGCLYEAGFRGGRACAVRSVALPFRSMITVDGLQEELLAIAQRPLEQAGKWSAAEPLQTPPSSKTLMLDLHPTKEVNPYEHTAS